jgi:ribosomal protein S18 acetylase RimI-like enzyme|tara:strand:- start:226 stop:747 length:522 start_codon:yes stop_codon:yes gene_type:complete
MTAKTSIAIAKILDAGLDDLPDIKEIANTIWFEHYPGIITHEQIAYMLARDYSLETMTNDLAAGVSIDKLVVGEALAGFASYGATKNEEVIKLHKLYLLKTFHGRGLGSMLLAHVENKAQQAGFKSITLNVNKNNQAALNTYRSNGYENHQSVLVDIGGGFFMDDYVMAKALG